MAPSIPRKFELSVLAVILLVVVAFVGPVALYEMSAMTALGVVGEKPDPSMDNYQTIEEIEVINQTAVRVHFGEHVVLEMPGNDDPAVQRVVLRHKRDDYSTVEVAPNTSSVVLHADANLTIGALRIVLHHTDVGQARTPANSLAAAIGDSGPYDQWGPPGPKHVTQYVEFEVTDDGNVVVTHVPANAIYPPN